MINLYPRHEEIVRRILKKHVPDATVWVFGSRVKQTANNSSDLDLAIVSQSKIPLQVMNLLKFDFEESDLPFKVDVLDWQSISDDFKKVIKEKYVVFDHRRASVNEAPAGYKPK